MKRALALSMTMLGLAAAGCGGNDDSEQVEEEGDATTPREAITEIGEVREGLDAGLTAYRKGDAEQAERLVGDAYLEHFELVEGPLEERDPELNEELEVLISTTVRDAIKESQPATQVASLVARADDGLEQAEGELRKG